MADEVASVVARELGATPSDITRVEEGLLHETYEVDYDGETYVLQFSADEAADRNDALRRGLWCYVALRDADVPVPDVVTETPGETVDGRAYSIVEKLPGETGERTVSPERTRNAGRYLARIHDARRFDAAGWLQCDDGFSVRKFSEGGLREWLLENVAETASVLRAGGLEAAGRAVAGLFDSRGADLPASFQPVLCHDDFSPDNVLFEGNEVTGVLDFDRAWSSHDQLDVAKAANGFWMHDPCADWDVRAAFYDGYRDERDLEESFERHEPLYRVETLAGTVAGLLELEELSAYEREFYDERILAAVERAERRCQERPRHGTSERRS